MPPCSWVHIPGWASFHVCYGHVPSRHWRLWSSSGNHLYHQALAQHWPRPPPCWQRNQHLWCTMSGANREMKQSTCRTQSIKILHLACSQYHANLITAAFQNVSVAFLESKTSSNNNNRFAAIIQVNQHQTAPPVQNCKIELVQFYCPHALADGNQCIQISEKTLEFSSTVLSTLSLYLLSKFL